MMKARTCFAVALLWCASGCRQTPLASQPSPLKVEMRHFEKVVPGCGDQEKLVQPCFSFQVSYPEVKSATAPEAVATLNAHILALLQPVGAPAGFAGEAERLVEQYQNRPRGGAGEEEPAWFVRRTAEVIHSTAAALSIRAERTEYLGGAAASTAYECVNLHPATGEQYRLQDLLVEGAEDRLRAVAEARFRAERKIGAGQRLSEAGFVFLEGKFALPRQFLLVQRGIELIFTPNEVFQESTAPIHLIVPWGELAGLIREETGVVPVPSGR